VILVYQMGKVASQSWRQAIEALDPTAEPPVHVHHLAAPLRSRLAQVFDLPPPYQTIVNRIMARDQQRKGTAALARIEACRRSGETIRIVTGMRDPVPRSISVLMFLADFYDHTSRPISARKGATAEYLSQALHEIWASVFTDLEPACSFEWIARYSIGLYRSWFADELEAVFGIDVLSTPFPRSGPQRLSAPGVEVLVYRVEDMAPAAPSHRELLDAAAEFLGMPIGAFPEANTAATRRSHLLYDALRADFRLPRNFIDPIYDCEAVRHFYAPGEIESFKVRWRESADDPA